MPINHFKPRNSRGHDILIKYIEKEEYAEPLRYGGLYMHTPQFYRKMEVKNMSTADPNELDDLYPIWCASILHNGKDFRCFTDWINGGYRFEISKEASDDIIKSIKGFRVEDGEEFAPLGNYLVVIFNAAEYIGKLVEGLTDALFMYSEEDEQSIPIECGRVSYGVINKNHPKLYKEDMRFKYQREYRMRLGLKVDSGKFDVPLDLKQKGVFSEEFTNMKVYDKETIINDFNKNGVITFYCGVD